MRKPPANGYPLRLPPPRQSSTLQVVDTAPAGAALAQLKARGYADKYRTLGQPIHLVGVELDKHSRNLAAFDVERA